MVKQRHLKIILILLICTSWLHAQIKETDSLLSSGELKMTFPSIYFKHNSTDFSTMPYSFDSCFKYIALHFNDNINSLVIWRDSIETEELTNKRIKKLKLELNKYIPSSRIDIHSMEEEQKISRRTINMRGDFEHIEYLLSLNSVLDISKTRFPTIMKWNSKSHIDLPRPWCLNCWRNGFHIKERKWRRSLKRKK